MTAGVTLLLTLNTMSMAGALDALTATMLQGITKPLQKQT